MATLRTTRSDIRIIGVREVNMPQTPRISDDFNELSTTDYSQNRGKSKWIVPSLVLLIIILICILTWLCYPLSTLWFIIHLIGYFLMGCILFISLYESGIYHTIKKLFL